MVMYNERLVLITSDKRNHIIEYLRIVIYSLSTEIFIALPRIKHKCCQYILLTRMAPKCS
ncbi:unnamed protein product, partial [Schistosoma rodhaini]|uniref:Uncharacterized protein n=1 Tax=Schistosoma rodhaini TaxID=6188 RepID=A0AA85F1Y5_9TREM